MSVAVLFSVQLSSVVLRVLTKRYVKVDDVSLNQWTLIWDTLNIGGQSWILFFA